MLRALILAALICVCGVFSSAAADTRLVNKRSTMLTHNVATSVDAATIGMNNTPQPITKETVMADEVIDSKDMVEHNERHYFYHPAVDTKPQVLEEFNRRYLDGTYEFKFTLSNGVSRYEKSYWKPKSKGKKVLARMGFYSHPLTNGKYLTVFYTADENGYHEDIVKYTTGVPNLPKHLDIPQLGFPKETSKPHITATIATTTRKPIITTKKVTTRKPKGTTTEGPVVEPTKFNWIY